jgi:hypothetical protein
MIQANELRIGNLFYFNNPSAWNNYLNEIVVISKIKNEITEKEKETWKYSFGSVSFYLLKDKNETFNQFSQYIKPIPLTEEILLKCGFVKGFDNFYRKNKSYMIEICFFDKGILVTNQSVCLSGIKHLHQLQNLYFALTCKELEINLKS